MKKLIILILAVWITGCSNVTGNVNEGRPINYSLLSKLTLGLSTQEDVKQVFGYPQNILYPDNRTIYQYRYEKKSGFEHVVHAVDFVFNKNQRVIDITINDGLKQD